MANLPPASISAISAVGNEWTDGQDAGGIMSINGGFGDRLVLKSDCSDRILLLLR